MTATRAVRTRRIVRWVAIGVGAYSVIAAFLILTAAIVNDLRIDQDMGSAVATVTDVSATRAAIEFDTEEGVNQRPSAGVFYPTGLVDGQQVRVEYRRANPDLVRVSGRSWVTALVPALSVPLVAVPLSVGVYVWASPGIHRRSSRFGSLVPR